MNRVVLLSPLLLIATLSPAQLQVSCDRSGNANLSSLEIEAAGLNRVVGFTSTVGSYDVWTTSGVDTITVRAQAFIADARINYTLTAGTVESGLLGLGNGEVTLTIPPDTPANLVLDVSDGGTRRTYNVDINPTCSAGECDDNSPCTTDACVSSTCEFTNLADGTACTDADGGQDQCVAGVCPSNAVTKPFSMGCFNNVFAGWFPATWALTVDPITPVVAGQPFDVAISGEVSVETSLDAVAGFAQVTYPRTFTFGTVPILARSGATGVANADISDENGLYVCAVTGTVCDPANDTAGMFSDNTDCVGLISDWCLPFEATNVIDDTGNQCATCAAADDFVVTDQFQGIGMKQQLCEFSPVVGQPNDVCTDSLPIPLAPLTATFVAEPGAPEVLFGFEEGDAIWDVNPPALYDDGDGVDVLQMALAIGNTGNPGELTIAANCFMGAVTFDQLGSSLPLDPLPDSALISIPVELIRSWGTPELLETGTGDARQPEVAVDPNGNAVVVWRQLDGTEQSIYANRLTSGAWGSPELLETGTDYAWLAHGGAVDPSGDAVVVWYQGPGGVFSIYAARLTSGVWGTPELLETDPNNAAVPDVAIDSNGDAVAVWRQRQQTGVSPFSIYAARLTSGVWGTPELLETGAGDAVWPTVAVDPSGDAVVVWYQDDGGAFSIYGNRLTSGVWGTAELLETGAGDAVWPAVAVDPNGDAVVAWEQLDGTERSIYANRLTSGVWGTAELLETGTEDAFQPQVAMDLSGDAVVVWPQDDGGVFSIYANRLTSGVWGTPELLETGAGDASSPTVAIDPNGNAMVVWSQNDGSADSIYANRFIKQDLVWGTPELLETGAGDASSPTVAIDPNGAAVVVWHQDDGGALSIYANRFE